MGGKVSVSLLVTVVFGHVVEVIAADDDGALHLGGDDHPLKNFASDWDVAGEGTFFIDVGAFNSLLGGSEVEANVLVIPYSWGRLFGEQFLRVKENGFLLLESSLLLG